MPEGRRYSPENPSPAMQDLAQYIRDHGYPQVTDEAVAATSYFHKEWQRQHAAQTRAGQEERAKAKEAEKAKKAEEKAKKDKEREEAKAKKEQEAAEKKAKKEAEKAEKESAAQGADGDDTSTESSKTSRRLRVREDTPQPVAAGVSETSF